MHTYRQTNHSSFPSESKNCTESNLIIKYIYKKKTKQNYKCKTYVEYKTKHGVIYKLCISTTSFDFNKINSE